MPWPFDREYMQLALAAGVVVGACAPLIGTFLVHKQMSLLGDGIGHLAFAGVAGGLLLGIWPVWSALAVAVLGAVAIERLRARGRASGDLALALFFYGGVAAAVVLAGRSSGGTAKALPYLFGSLLTVTRGDVAVVAVTGAAIVTTVLVAGRAMFAILVDEESARVAGLPVDTLNTLLVAMAALTVVAALMVLPVGTARLVAASFRSALILGAVVGVTCVVIGLATARAWALAPGGSIVLTAAAAFAATALATGARRGGISLPR